MASKTKDINFNDLVFNQGTINQNAKGITAIYFDDIKKENISDNVSLFIKDGFLNIVKGVNTLKLTNYTGIKYIKTKNSELTDVITDGLIQNQNPVIINKQKLTVSGLTNYSDSVDLSDIKDLKKTVNKQVVNKVSSDKGFTLDGLKGNDTIIGSMYSDIIKHKLIN